MLQQASHHGKEKSCKHNDGPCPHETYEWLDTRFNDQHVILLLHVVRAVDTDRHGRRPRLEVLFVVG